MRAATKFHELLLNVVAFSPTIPDFGGCYCETALKERLPGACDSSKGDKYELLVPKVLSFFLVTEEDSKFGIRYLQWLLYRMRAFVSCVKRSYKASEEVQAFVKATGAQRHPSK